MKTISSQTVCVCVCSEDTIRTHALTSFRECNLAYWTGKGVGKVRLHSLQEMGGKKRIKK